MKEPKEINVKAVQDAHEILGIRPSLIAALVYCENGPENLETGSIDKTEYYATHFPIEEWSYLDGSRTLSRMAWEWFFTTKEGQKACKQFLTFAATPYTHTSPEDQAWWVKNMIVAEKRFTTEIGVELYKPIVQMMRTPTIPTP